MTVSHKKLASGTRLRAKLAEIEVLEEIGGGSQGDVYLVKYGRQRKALKWYHDEALLHRKGFAHNLKNNVNHGAPSEEFLWPLDVTEVMDDGCFGYIMDLRPQEYRSADEVLLHPNLFPSYRRIVDVCLNIAHAFRMLHQPGYVYRDISAGNFFVNPQTGRILICDNDNVAPSGFDTGIRGTPRFMAPEIVVNNCVPTEKSDRHSMATIIFYLMMMHHPLEGMRADMLDIPTQKRIYGTDPLFIFDPSDRSNAPLPDSPVLTMWSSLPEHMRKMFIRAFSRDALTTPSHRPSEIDWIRELVRLRSEIVLCPHCRSNEVFLQDAQPGRCDNPGCHAEVRVPMRLVVPHMGYALPAVSDTRVYACQTNIVCDAAKALDPVAWMLAVEGRGLCIRNVSNDSWKAHFQGNVYDIAPKKAAPAMHGVELEIGNVRLSIAENARA